MDQKISQGHRPDQNPLLVQDIANVDRLRIQTDAADALDGIRHCHVLLQIHILDRHDRACGILRVTQQVIDVRPGIRTRVGQDLLHDVCRHLLQKIRGIVRHQIVDHAGCLFVRKGLDNVLLIINVQIRKNIRRHILRQDAEDFEGILILQIIHHGRNICCLHFRGRLAKLCILLGLQKTDQNFFILTLLFFSELHGKNPPLCVVLMQLRPGAEPSDVPRSMKTTSFPAIDYTPATFGFSKWIHYRKIRMGRNRHFFKTAVSV